MNFSLYVLLFIIYSFIGWSYEVILTLIKKKKFVNRGFLIGPYCPIYGVGVLFVTTLLNDYLDKPLGLFILSVVICSLVEYIGSFLLEKIFKTSWWDYSSQRFNINGRICLETMIPFGLSCLLIMYIVNPFFIKILNLIPELILNILAIILVIGLLIDFIISFKIIWKFKKISDDAKKDNTEKVTEYVKNEILKRKKKLYTRLINAFPNLKILKKIEEITNGKNNNN